MDSQPGAAETVHGLAGEGAAEDGEQHAPVTHRDPAPVGQVSGNLQKNAEKLKSCFDVTVGNGSSEHGLKIFLLFPV